jgi:hypothetical protein
MLVLVDHLRMINQLILGTGSFLTTITAIATGSNRNYTIPDSGGIAQFVMSAGTQTIAGVKTFSSALTCNLTSNQLVLGTTNTTTITVPAPAASRTYTIPDGGAAAQFVMTGGTQALTGVKTFRGGIEMGTGVANLGITFLNNTTSYVPAVLSYYEEYSTPFTFNDNGTNISVTSTLKIIRVGRVVTLQVYEMSTFDDTAPTRTRLISASGVIPDRFKPLSNFAVAVHLFIGSYTFGMAKFTTGGNIEIYTNPALDLTPTWLATTNAFYGVTVSYDIN